MCGTISGACRHRLALLLRSAMRHCGCDARPVARHRRRDARLVRCTVCGSSAAARPRPFRIALSPSSSFSGSSSAGSSPLGASAGDSVAITGGGAGVWTTGGGGGLRRRSVHGSWRQHGDRRALRRPTICGRPSGGTVSSDTASFCSPHGLWAMVFCSTCLPTVVQVQPGCCTPLICQSRSCSACWQMVRVLSP